MELRKKFNISSGNKHSENSEDDKSNQKIKSSRFSTKKDSGIGSNPLAISPVIADNVNYLMQ